METGSVGALRTGARRCATEGTCMNVVQLAPETLERRTLLGALRALKKGDFGVRMPLDLSGIDGEIAAAFNALVDMNERFATELTRIGEQVGKQGQIGQRLRIGEADGFWASAVDSVNTLVDDVVRPMAAVTQVVESVANGSLSQRMLLDIDGAPLRGEFQRIGRVVNTMVDQLNGFASEVSRVAREVGTEGKLGGQARVLGELNGFASEVSRVAREVGTEGKLGGQARVLGVAGTWKDLTDNVNQLAANLTSQVRAIAEVATAVTNGDLTRSIMVEARGEVAALKDNINEMICNLKDTTLKSTEQDWLKTNLAKFSRMLQGHADLVAVSRLVLSELAPLVRAQHGVLYRQSQHGADARLELLASYASSRHLKKRLQIGEGLVGQCALEKKRILLEEVRPDYVRVNSALGSASPLHLIIMPVLFEGEVKAVLELASLRKFSPTYLSFLEQLAETIGVVFNTIEANMRTGDLLQRSQSLTGELQKQQDELKQSNDRLEHQAESLQRSEALLKIQQQELRRANDELQQKALLLSEQMRQVEYKNREVELAKAALEEKAEQLAQTSRYKSEFLANMSHELRTPLNSLLILAKLLADNAGDNLTPKQIDYAQTIYAAGAELLSLISDILDLAKIESGTITLDFGPLRLTDLRDYIERTFRPTAREMKLAFSIDIDAHLPPVIETDEKRLRQILKNLLSNAFKFTADGRVELQFMSAAAGWSPGNARLDSAKGVLAFAVCDTGVGIPDEKQGVIFEAFQQADGTTSRQYGGTGLGLSISRELTQLFGGEISVESDPGKGTRFVVYLPLLTEVAASAPPLRADAGPATRTVSPRTKAAVPAPATPYDLDKGLAGRTVLIVDDDIRNVFALTQALELCGITVLNAADGKECIEIIKSSSDIDIVLMDIMMPKLDGYETIRIIRGLGQFRDLPIIAVTARAMKGDREKCLEAGASDYMAKPIDVEQLTALLRVWVSE